MVYHKIIPATLVFSAWRSSTEHTVVRIGERELPTVHGTFRLISYEDRIEGGLHMAMVMGDIRRDEPVLVRVHVVDPLRDLRFQAVDLPPVNCGFAP